jgi:hypothetical protein
MIAFRAGNFMVFGKVILAERILENSDDWIVKVGLINLVT